MVSLTKLFRINSAFLCIKMVVLKKVTPKIYRTKKMNATKQLTEGNNKAAL
jgi:hypothetical protein